MSSTEMVATAPNLSNGGTLRRRLAFAAMGLGCAALLQQDVAILGSFSGRTDLEAATLLQAAQRAETCTAANAVGVGLRGEYFAQESFGGPTLLTRVDSVVDFDASLEWPADQASQPKSVRWAGWVKPPLSGDYRFHAEAPNMRVLVAREVVAGGLAPADATVNLAAGRFYPIVVEVSKLPASSARIRLEWTAPHGARYLLPRTLLHLPTETAAKPGG